MADNIHSIACASPMFLNHTDLLKKNAEHIKKLDGYDDIVVHSTALYFVCIDADNKETDISPDEMAKLISNFYEGKVPNLRLIACKAGALETKDGAAQKLANLLNVNIIAPIGTVYVDYKGDLSVEDPITHETIIGESGWRLFKPQ